MQRDYRDFRAKATCRVDGAQTFEVRVYSDRNYEICCTHCGHAWEGWSSTSQRRPSKPKRTKTVVKGRNEPRNVVSKKKGGGV